MSNSHSKYFGSSHSSKYLWAFNPDSDFIFKGIQMISYALHQFAANYSHDQSNVAEEKKVLSGQIWTFDTEIWVKLDNAANNLDKNRSNCVFLRQL